MADGPDVVAPLPAGAVLISDHVVAPRLVAAGAAVADDGLPTAAHGTADVTGAPLDGSGAGAAAVGLFEELVATGSPDSAEALEGVVHNALLGEVGLGGASRAPGALAALGQVPQWVAGVSEGALWLHLPIDCRITADVPGVGKARLRVTTRYPDDGRIELRIDGAPEAEVALVLRIPSWSRRSRVTVNGEAVETDGLAGDHLVIEAPFVAGDRIHVDLDVSPRLVGGGWQIAEARGSAVVACGPRLFCAEPVDHPYVNDLAAVALDASEVPRTTFEPGILGGTTVVRTTGWSRQVVEGASPFAPLDELAARPVRLESLTLVPWAVRGNRESRAQDAALWLPLG